MIIRRHRHGRAGAAGIALASALSLSLILPLPTLPDHHRTAVANEVSERLPGWTIERLDRSWERGYTVVAACVGRQVGFQWVPGHGLPGDDAWIQPNDEYSRARLARTSDHWRHLVWYAVRQPRSSLSCAEELAGVTRAPSGVRGLD